MTTFLGKAKGWAIVSSLKIFIPFLQRRGMFSLRLKMLISYLVFAAFLAIFAYVCFHFYRERERASLAVIKLDSLQRLFLEANRLEDHLFLYQLTDTAFYAHHSSAGISRHATLVDQLTAEIQRLSESEEATELKITRPLQQIRQLVAVRQQIFDTTVTLSLLRGFKDYGQEGTMRLYAHALEYTPLERQDLLMLRRHEKDYIIRKDPAYIRRFFSLINRLNHRYQSDRHTALLLSQYSRSFRRLTQTDAKLGLTPTTGYRGKMRELTRQIDALFNATTGQAQHQSQLIRNQLAGYLMGMIGCVLLLCILMSLLFSHLMTRPLQSLTQQVDQVALSGFETITSPIAISSRDEIGTLTDHINQMLCQIQMQLEEVHASSEQLNEQNKELQQYNQLLAASETQLQQMNRVKDRFFAIISHDLRGPLISAHNFMTLYEEDGDLFSIEEMKRMMAHSSRSIKHMLSLLDNLLSWSLMQINHIDFNPQWVVLADLFEKNHQLLKPALVEKKIDFVLESGAQTTGAELRIWADAHMLDFIIRNLVSNAIKFTHPSGSIRLRVTLTSSVEMLPRQHVPMEETNPDASQWLEIQVIDTGVGINEFILARIQSGLERKITDTSAIITTEGTHQEKGTGLGLVICREFVGKHQGSIRFESSVGKGTCVTVRLPLLPAQEEKTMAAQASPHPNASPMVDR